MMVPDKNPALTIFDLELLHHLLFQWMVSADSAHSVGHRGDRDDICAELQIENKDTQMDSSERLISIHGKRDLSGNCSFLQVQ